MPGPYWSDQWSPVAGCTHSGSPGCDHCWARSMHERFHTEPFSAVRVMPERLSVPLHWRKPRTVFVCNVSDLYHPSVPFEFVAAVYGVMAACPQHTFLTLTKRPERRVEFFAHTFGLESAAETVAREATRLAGIVWDARGPDAWRYINPPRADISNRRPWPGWPLPNVWEGVTAENQTRADERIPLLLATPAAHRWVSLEPLLGPVEIANGRANRWSVPTQYNARGRGIEYTDPGPEFVPLDQVIVGGESGPGARPCDLEWLRSIVRQCREAEAACMVKQVGSYAIEDCPVCVGGRHRPDDGGPFGPCCTDCQNKGYDLSRTKSRSGSDPAEWPADLRVRDLVWKQ